MRLDSMLLVLAFAAAVSTASLDRHVDASWGVLVRSSYLHGAWTITLDDGTRITGDWIVLNHEPYVSRDMGGGAGPSQAIHFVDSRHARACTVDAKQPLYLYCTGGLGMDARLAKDATLALPRGTTRLDSLDATFVPRRAGSIIVDAAPASPTLAQLELLFERTTGRTLADYFGATVTRAKKQLALTLPFREDRPRSDTPTYVRDVFEAVATIQIGPAPAAIAITARETAHHVEDCIAPPALHSCGPIPPTCTRRP